MKSAATLGEVKRVIIMIITSTRPSEDLLKDYQLNAPMLDAQEQIKYFSTMIAEHGFLKSGNRTIARTAIAYLREYGNLQVKEICEETHRRLQYN